MVKECFHTQENRSTTKLSKPIICVREDAWFGNAFYFWEALDDANYWGEVSKRATGEYDVYLSKINTENFLDTVFNEKHYRAWVSTVEKLALKFQVELGKKLSLKELNDYLKDKGLYRDICGISFQDISSNENHYLVKGLQYRKRIQFAVFNEDCIKEFVFLRTGKSRKHDRYR